MRFLWFEKDNIVKYWMTSHLFGGVWCSSSSTFALRQTVCDLSDHDLIKDTVLQAFHVDDLLKSVQSAEEVTLVINETRQVIHCGGFKLTKFVINDKQLLETIDVDDRASEVRSVVPDMCSRALGIQWHANEDSFRYVNKREQIDDATAITRGHILSCVSSMYDPLGQISPIVLTGKMIFQEVTRCLDWDDPVPDDLAQKWRAWQSSLQNLCIWSFSRCVVPAGFENGIAELHHFSDASAVGYGACNYLRVVTPDGRINVSLIASKGRLAPLKTITIPCLELTAAVTAVQLDILIRSSLDTECMPSTFWTDSKIVLAYICSKHKRFKVFVANHVFEIRRCTSVDQWCHINGDNNPADVVSQGCGVNDVPQLWFKGPEFLSQFKCDWPVVDNLHSNESLDDDLDLNLSSRDNITAGVHTVMCQHGNAVVNACAPCGCHTGLIF